jgi:hypothetical protein
MNPIPDPIGITDGSGDKIIITPHLITIHLTSTMGCNFIQLSGPIGCDCSTRSDFNTMDSLVIPQPESYEFHRIPTELPSVPIRSDFEFNHLDMNKMSIIEK